VLLKNAAEGGRREGEGEGKGVLKKSVRSLREYVGKREEVSAVG
jgi:hypothetical protein